LNIPLKLEAAHWLRRPLFRNFQFSNGLLANASIDMQAADDRQNSPKGAAQAARKNLPKPTSQYWPFFQVDRKTCPESLRKSASGFVQPEQ
jgi:hypothetical protein